MAKKQRKDCGILKGSSGLIPGFGHIAGAYSCNRNDIVFVEWQYRFRCEDGKIDRYDSWKRMTLKRAEKEGRKIIRCSKRGCNKPAAMIDHYYPYYIDMNLCEDHADKR